MKLINVMDMMKNINYNENIPMIIIKKLQNSTAQFIMEIALKNNISFSVTTLAIHLSNYFFYYKSYLYYDRYIIGCASFLIATKILDLHVKMDSICAKFYKVKEQIDGKNIIIDENNIKTIKDKICKMESEILHSINYELNFELPYIHLAKIVSFYKNHDKIYAMSRINILDIYRTGASLYFKSFEIAIAAVFMSSFYLNGKLLPDEFIENENNIENKKNIDNIEDKIKENIKLNLVNSEENYDDKNEEILNKFLLKISSNINIKSVFKIINMVDELLNIYETQ